MHARCCRYGVAFLYGGALVRDGDYTAGVVVQVMTAMLIGGFALGQAAPDFSYYVSGRAAAARLMHVINRKPRADGGVVPAAGMQARSRQPVSTCFGILKNLL